MDRGAFPILPARDLGETRAFYERLGFETTGWWPETFGGYAILTKGELQMHFFHFPELDPFASYAQCYWRVADADAIHREIERAGLPATGVPRLTRPGDQPWGMREFALVDPNGTLVRVGHRLGG